MTHPIDPDDLDLIHRAYAAFGGRRGVSRVIGIGPDHLRHVRQGRKRMTGGMRARLQEAIAWASRDN